MGRLLGVRSEVVTIGTTDSLGERVDSIRLLRGISTEEVAPAASERPAETSDTELDELASTTNELREG